MTSGLSISKSEKGETHVNVLDYQTQCKLALQGAAVHWSDTPIEITPAARATDPFKGLRGEWWKKAEPRYPDGREVIVIKTVDNKAEENQFVRQVADDELEPREDEPVNLWLARVATRGGTENPFWKALHSYAQRFRQDALARKTLDRKLVSSFLKNLKGTARSK